MKNISNSEAADKLIFALDAAGYDEAVSWIDILSGHVGMFKVGFELFTAAGPKIIDYIKQKNQRVFLDLKFHDIPNTVARAAEAAAKMGVDMFNVHASGGSKMIRDTVKAVETLTEKDGLVKPVILAVTVLTSLNDVDLQEIGFAKNTNDQVLHLASLANAAGASGVVASAQDIVKLRSGLGNDFIIVTPGIRSSREPVKDDQKRTLSATEAVKLGADYIVVGRPIRQATDPLAACEQIVKEISEGMTTG
ncbi:MAG: Orotidine 5'-phosphate decarboxylase [Smithella sp. PtaU1.Bin162]|nr:MAG: Orotidine 5'-phosphate decarboxylase [Smithella sp. PtaU1.Bin162]